MADAIRYGGSLILYLVVLYVVGGVGVFLGIAMMGVGSRVPVGDGILITPLLGLLLVLIGYLIVVAGTLGIGYKVIADGVSRGVDNSAAVRTLLDES